MKKRPIVEVEWVDSNQYGRWADPTEKIRAMEISDAMTCYSAGYLLKRCKSYIAIAQSEMHPNSGTNVADTIQIPHAAIRKFRIVDRRKS